MKSLPVTSLPQSATIESVATDGLRHAAFITFTDPRELPVELGFVQDQRRHLGIARIDSWTVWFTQHFGDTASAVPDETVLLLWEKAGSSIDEHHPAYPHAGGEAFENVQRVPRLIASSDVLLTRRAERKHHAAEIEP